MHDNLIAFYLVAGLVALILGLGKGGLGGTLGVLATPLMSLVMPVTQVVGLILPMLILGDVFAVYAHWRRWDQRLLNILLAGGILGVLAGTFVLTSVSPLVLRRALGVFVLLFVAYKLIEEHIARGTAYDPHAWVGVLAGSLSGLTSTLAHAGGPPVAIYLLLKKVEPRTFAATLALFFAVTNLFKVPSYLVAHLFSLDRILRIIWVLPLLPLGVWLGKWISIHLKHEVYEKVILALLTLAAVLLLFT